MLSRDELLLRAALATRGSTEWQHGIGEGWTERPFSPERLEAMANPELEELIAERARNQAEAIDLIRKEYPDVEWDTLSDPLDDVGFCDICLTDIGRTAEVYLAWDEASREWSVYCAAHRPDRYWRHLNRS